jgi:hypothetical protein
MVQLTWGGCKKRHHRSAASAKKRKCKRKHKHG